MPVLPWSTRTFEVPVFYSGRAAGCPSTWCTKLFSCPRSSLLQYPVLSQILSCPVPYPVLSQILSSKAVGEPPLFLGASVFFAIKEAIYAARKEEVRNVLYRSASMLSTSPSILQSYPLALPLSMCCVETNEA